MKKLIATMILASAASYGIDSWACRPNIYGIQHNLVMASIAAIYEKEGFSVLDLQEKSLKNFTMEFVSSDPGTGCPDRYKTKVHLLFKNSVTSKSYEVDVTTERNREDIITIKP